MLFDRHSYVLGPNGNRTQHAELNGRVVDYVYDDLYRLTTETVTDATLGNRTSSWTYDAVGNRLTQTESDASGTTTTTYVYDDNDRLLTETAVGAVPSSLTYSYDANGNTLSKTDGTTTTTYAYDSRNRLSNLNAGQVTYLYDATGIRMSETSAGLTTHYLVDPNRDYAQVVEESLDLNSFAEVRYTYGDDLIAQHRRIDATTTNSSTFHYDGIGSTRQLTDLSGTVTDTYAFEAFGELEGSTGFTVNDYLYTGEQFDPNLGFYYLRARYYNPAVGRFANQDVWPGLESDPRTLHKYLYAHLDPVNMIDPTGFTTIGSTLSTINTLGNLYTAASISFQFLTGNVAGGSAQLAEEIVYSKFGGAFGKKVVNLSKKQLALFFRIFKRGTPSLRLGLRPNSAALRHNMQAVGVKAPAGGQAHHIAGNASKFGKLSQERLSKLGVDLNSPTNGVFLPGCGSSKAIGMIHCGRHTRAYEKEVWERLRHAKTDVDAINIMSDIRNQLLNNTFIPLNLRAIP